MHQSRTPSKLTSQNIYVVYNVQNKPRLLRVTWISEQVITTKFWSVKKASLDLSGDNTTDTICLKLFRHGNV